ncbi:MAG: hypothetical protein BWY83_01243 [bacterium ADurb.Bin478]|nr:MAG: hypothetical protein BWY83_01243 [bacterium ADurb.Bin478]
MHPAVDRHQSVRIQIVESVFVKHGDQREDLFEIRLWAVEGDIQLRLSILLRKPTVEVKEHLIDAQRILAQLKVLPVQVHCHVQISSQFRLGQIGHSIHAGPGFGDGRLGGQDKLPGGEITAAMMG